jgi:hypothetical protein
MAIPSALAVLRFRISSTFVARRSYDQTAIAGTPEGLDVALNFGGVAEIDWDCLYADRWCHGLNDGKLTNRGGLSRKTAARFMPGATCLSGSGHLALKLYSNCMKPVAQDRARQHPCRRSGGERLPPAPIRRGLRALSHFQRVGLNEPLQRYNGLCYRHFWPVSNRYTDRYTNRSTQTPNRYSNPNRYKCSGSETRETE